MHEFPEWLDEVHDYLEPHFESLHAAFAYHCIFDEHGGAACPEADEPDSQRMGRAS